MNTEQQPYEEQNSQNGEPETGQFSQEVAPRIKENTVILMPVIEAEDVVPSLPGTGYYQPYGSHVQERQHLDRENGENTAEPQDQSMEESEAMFQRCVSNEEKHATRIAARDPDISDQSSAGDSDIVDEALTQQQLDEPGVKQENETETDGSVGQFCARELGVEVEPYDFETMRQAMPSVAPSYDPQPSTMSPVDYDLVMSGDDSQRSATSKNHVLRKKIKNRRSLHAGNVGHETQQTHTASVSSVSERNPSFQNTERSEDISPSGYAHQSGDMNMAQDVIWQWHMDGETPAVGELFQQPPIESAPLSCTSNPLFQKQDIPYFPSPREPDSVEQNGNTNRPHIQKDICKEPIVKEETELPSHRMDQPVQRTYNQPVSEMVEGVPTTVYIPHNQLYQPTGHCYENAPMYSTPNQESRRHSHEYHPRSYNSSDLYRCSPILPNGGKHLSGGHEHADHGSPNDEEVRRPPPNLQSFEDVEESFNRLEVNIHLVRQARVQYFQDGKMATRFIKHSSTMNQSGLSLPAHDNSKQRNYYGNHNYHHEHLNYRQRQDNSGGFTGYGEHRANEARQHIQRIPQNYYEQMRDYCGPLTQENQKAQVTSFCEAQIKAFEKGASRAQNKQEVIAILEYLLLNLKTNGDVTDRDACVWLVKSCRKDLSTSGWQIVPLVEKCMVYGAKKSLKKFARNNSIDTCKEAAALAHILNGCGINTCDESDPDDPMKTLHELLSTEQVPTICHELASSAYRQAEWRLHLAMILAQRQDQPHLASLVKHSIMTMGDTLARNGYIYKAHLCYLLADRKIGDYHDPKARIILLGAESKFPVQTCDRNDVFQFTEIYEFTQSRLTRSQLKPFPQLVTFKISYMGRLNMVGFTEKALEYFKVIYKTMVENQEYPYSPHILREVLDWDKYFYANWMLHFEQYKEYYDGLHAMLRQVELFGWDSAMMHAYRPNSSQIQPQSAGNTATSTSRSRPISV